MIYETGTCDYTVKWKVYTQTSENELRGRDVFWGEFPSELDARIAMANAPECFTKGEWGWRARGGYTTADIRRVVEYGDLKPNTI